MVTVTLREILLPSMNCHETGSKFKKIKIKVVSSYLLSAEYKAQPRKEASTSALNTGGCTKSQTLGKLLTYSLEHSFVFNMVFYFFLRFTYNLF